MDQAPEQIGKRPRPWKGWVVAVSLANLCFYPVWAQLLPGSYGHYYLKNPPAPSVNVGAIFGMLLLALFFGAAFLLVRALGSGRVPFPARLLFFALFLLALNGIRTHHFRFSSLAPAESPDKLDALCKLALALAALAAFTPWRRRVVHGAVTAALLLSPFAAVTLAEAGWAAAKPGLGIPFAEFSDQPAAPPVPSKPGGRRVVWFLFDGMDQLVVFANRPAGVKLPNLDRFRSEAVYAPYAYSPGGSTILSIPGLLMGKHVDEARPLRANELMVRFSDTQQRVSWGDQPNVFSRARELGMNSALAGYHHPYGRVLGGNLVSCVWAADRWDSIGLDDPKVSAKVAASGFLSISAERILASLPFVWRVPILSELQTWLQQRRPLPVRLAEHVQTYRTIREAAQGYSTDPALGLVFVHWPVPHHPFIYDQAKGDFRTDQETSYDDNLALADRTLGEMRGAMERAGVWEDSTVIITADHGFGLSKQSRSQRRPDVVFLLKLPGQKKEVLCQTPFVTALIPDLIVKLLRGEPADPRSVVAWVGKSPWIRERIEH